MTYGRRLKIGDFQLVAAVNLPSLRTQFFMEKSLTLLSTKKGLLENEDSS